MARPHARVHPVTLRVRPCRMLTCTATYAHLPCRLAPACSRHERWRAVPGSVARASSRTPGIAAHLQCAHAPCSAVHLHCTCGLPALCERSAAHVCRCKCRMIPGTCGSGQVCLANHVPAAEGVAARTVAGAFPLRPPPPAPDRPVRHPGKWGHFPGAGARGRALGPQRLRKSARQPEPRPVVVTSRLVLHI